MTHVTLHVSAGMLAATAVMTPSIRRAWTGGAPLARPVGRWIAASLAAGLFAAVPSLLRHAGAPDAFCDGWWMNGFVFYPLIRALAPRGGMPLGALVLALAFAAQYATVLLAIRRAAKTRARRGIPERSSASLPVR